MTVGVVLTVDRFRILVCLSADFTMDKFRIVKYVLM